MHKKQCLCMSRLLVEASLAHLWRDLLFIICSVAGVTKHCTERQSADRSMSSKSSSMMPPSMNNCSTSISFSSSSSNVLRTSNLLDNDTAAAAAADDNDVTQYDVMASFEKQITTVLVNDVNSLSFLIGLIGHVVSLGVTWRLAASNRLPVVGIYIVVGLIVDLPVIYLLSGNSFIRRVCIIPDILNSCLAVFFLMCCLA